MITLYTPQFYMRMPCRPFFFSSLGIIYGLCPVRLRACVKSLSKYLVLERVERGYGGIYDWGVAPRTKAVL